jgi:exodeoxyribonuclease-3
MKVATWNVNSIRARLERLQNWLTKNQPDVLCLQELKTVDENFPFDEIGALGYHAAVYGQKTYNGVAILSREEPQDVQRGFGDEDPQARSIACTIGGIRVINVYVPNGGEVGSDKFAYKLDWMTRLRNHIDTHYSQSDKLLVCGDTNVALSDSDVANPGMWAESVLCTLDVRKALTELVDWGLTDLHHALHPQGGVYSWWDYRQLAFPKNDGLRIDHILATETLAKKCTGIAIDRDERKGSKPSDHAPVIAEFR